MHSFERPFRILARDSLCSSEGFFCPLPSNVVDIVAPISKERESKALRHWLVLACVQLFLAITCIADYSG